MTKNEMTTGSAPDLWIDASDAPEQLDALRVPAQVRDDMAQFIRDGYAVLPGAIAPADVDAIVADTLAIHAEPDRFVLKNKGAYVDPVDLDGLNRGHRIVDIYAISGAARRAIFAPRVSAMLRTIFAEPAVAMQSISFEYGSQQAIHQDTAYVIARKPLAFAAIWIALEDVEYGTGELIYYPGGHRFAPYMFGGERRHWIAGRDGQDVHREFLAQLHVQAQERGIKMQRFLAKKGDVFVWHADLPHGGSQILQDRTRRSLVVHFVPLSVKAQYSSVIGDDYFESPSLSGDFFTSRHYRLAKSDDRGRAELLYDGGVSKRRRTTAATISTFERLG